MAKVLLVEDTENIQKMYAFGLQREGFEVLTASSGGEALARMDENHFDVILLDMMLAGMSGLDFLKEYDVKTKSPGTKVVAFSNLDNPSIEARIEQAGVDAYLNKSHYELKQLSDYLKQMLAPSG